MTSCPAGFWGHLEVKEEAMPTIEWFSGRSRVMIRVLLISLPIVRLIYWIVGCIEINKKKKEKK